MTEKRLLKKLKRMKGKMMKLFYIFCGFLFFTYSCKTIKLKTEPGADYSIEEIREKYKANQGNFQSFSASRISVSVSDNDRETNIRGNFRLIRDNAILVSLNAGLGLELVRGYLTEESIQIIDRINSEYSKMNYSQIKGMVGIDADYDLVENLLLNSFSFQDLLTLKDYSISTDNESVIVHDKQSVLINGFDEVKIFFGKGNLIVHKIDLFNNHTKHFSSIEYRDFIQFENGIIIPQEIKIFVNRGPETIELVVRYLKSEINTVRGLNFTVPSRYL